ncbi:MAG: hypothetical protein HY471_01950 [Candidatus Sungbacteria bacterium]|nr:hypothetical protein [Candidatus Sungbacteria bacterium]
MIEIVIMLSILTFISAILLTSIPGFNEDAAVVRAQQELALNFRRIQNIAFAVAQITLSDGSQIAPSRIGLHFDIATPDSYFSFIDSDADGIYTEPPADQSKPDRKLDTFTFQRGIQFDPGGAFYNQSGGVESIVNVVFAAPEAKASIFRQDTLGGGPHDIGGSLCLDLKTPSLDLRKAIRAWTSGQIAVEDGCL